MPAAGERSAPGRRPLRLLHTNDQVRLHTPPTATIRTNNPPCYTLHAEYGGLTGVSREGQILGMVEFLAEMVHFVDLFRPKLRPWLGRSSVQREAGRASCAGAAATLGPQTSFCEASQCGRQG